jgi:hypothetical protein
MASHALLPLKRLARSSLDRVAGSIGYVRARPSYLTDVFGFRLFQSTNDAGINYASLQRAT